MRPLAVAAALTVAGWLGSAALAATFVLDSGEAIRGEIVQATRNTITIRRAAGGMRQLPLGRLVRVEVTTADGRRLSGRYRGWRDGRSAIEVGSELLWLEHDRVVERTALEPSVPATATARPAPPPPPSGPSLTRPALADDPRPAIAPAAGPERGAAVTGALPPHEPAAPAARPADDLPMLSVKTSPAEIDEKSGTIVFDLELSRPLDDLLVVIYSTVDGGAAAGSDYQPLQGILTLAPGTTRSEIRTGVIDDDEAEGDEAFQLFLASNPDLTAIEQPWTKVTIHDDD